MRSLNEFFMPTQNLNNIQNGSSSRENPVPDDCVFESVYFSVSGSNPLDSDVVVTLYRNYETVGTLTLPNGLAINQKAEEYFFSPKPAFSRGDIVQLETDAAQTLAAALTCTMVFKR